MFNEDLLIQYRELYSKGQHIDPVLPPEIINEKEEYKVEEIRNHCCGNHLSQRTNDLTNE